MPRPHAPPTPSYSSDIRGEEAGITAPAFALPPTAFQDSDRASISPSMTSNNGSDSSYRPISPAAPTEVPRKRPATSIGPVTTKDDFSLPPPPTRSRKIIQMKPRDSEIREPAQETTEGLSSQTTRKPTTQAGGRKKQAGAGSTAAGRKIARKTAHSLIERRRRSKMNEEFGVLKDMIPACRGQEMHKLAILQASIEYLRYLERCVQDLQAQNNSPRPQAPPPTAIAMQEDDEDEDDNEDEEMDEDNADDNAASTPATTAADRSRSLVSLPSLSQITTATTTSPSVFSSGAGRHYSVSSASQASYSPFVHSNQTSPAFGPQLHHISTAPAYGSLGLGSPALKPVDHHWRQMAESAVELSDKRRSTTTTPGRMNEDQLDQEATAALLMLNTDRRQWCPAKQHESDDRRSNGGMSVRDLLSG